MSRSQCLNGASFNKVRPRTFFSMDLMHLALNLKSIKCGKLYGLVLAENFRENGKRLSPNTWTLFFIKRAGCSIL